MEKEIKLVWKAIHKLAEAQKKTEVTIKTLTQRVNTLSKNLAIFQKRTETAIRNLTIQINRLSEHVSIFEKRTETAIRGLNVRIGRLSDNIGFGLEDIAKVVLPGYFLKHYEIKIDTLKREFIELNGKFFEINLYGIGKRNGKKVIIAGEYKSRIYLREVKRFDGMIKKLNFRNEVLKFMFGYFIDPYATKEAKKRNIVLVTSYPSS